MSKNSSLLPAQRRKARTAERLLSDLSGQGAYGFSDPDDPARIVVAASKRGASLRIGSSTAACAQELVSMDWARWSDDARPRLSLTDAGRAALSRKIAEAAGAEPFQAQHRDIKRTVIFDGGEMVPVALDRAESPIARLAARRNPDGSPMLDPACVTAGERLRADLERAAMLPSVTVNWSGGGARGPGGGALHFSDMAIAARQRVRRALDAVGPDFAGLLVDVCGFLKGLECVETERRWPARSAKLVLSLGLAQLARHYGLSPEARGPDSAKSLLHWGAEDYRPAIDPA